MPNLLAIALTDSPLGNPAISRLRFWALEAERLGAGMLMRLRCSNTSERDTPNSFPMSAWDHLDGNSNPPTAPILRARSLDSQP